MSVFVSKEIRFTKEWSGNDKHLLLSNTGWIYRISVSRKTQDRSRSLSSARQKITTFLFNNPVWYVQQFSFDDNDNTKLFKNQFMYLLYLWRFLYALVSFNANGCVRCKYLLQFAFYYHGLFNVLIRCNVFI